MDAHASAHASAHAHTHDHASAALAEHLREIEVKHETFHVHDPEKELATLSAFRHSLAFVRCMAFLLDLCEAVRGHAISSMPPATAPVARLCALLQRIDEVVDNVEPVTTVTRFGNPAFKTLIAQLRQARPELERRIVGDDSAPPPPELFEYLLASLGDAVRVDYGTGHELSFLAFVASLSQLRIIGAADLCAVGLTLLSRYFALVRKLQKRYRLEPAGSRGCWGLDDYQFLPFLVGSAQLATHPRLRPKSVLDAGVREAFAHDFMYLAAIVHVHDLKVASFAEHSPMLNDITSVKDWASVYRGLLSMYNREVLGKHTIVQHFVYSALLPATAAPEPDLQAVLARLPVTAADRRMGPVIAPEEKVVCCSDVLHFPSSLAGK